MNPYNYSITVRRIEDEHEEPCFEARVWELPDVAEYADSFREAYELAVDTIETTAHALAEQGRKMPSPASPTTDYSGRITVRTTRTLHRELALLAEEENVSLNQLIVSVLGIFAGMKTARFFPTGGAHWQRAGASGAKLTDTNKPHLRIVRDQPVNPGGAGARPYDKSSIGTCQAVPSNT